MAKRYRGLLLDTEPYDAPPMDADYVLASDYDAVDSAATALGVHVQYCEARIRELEAKLAAVEAWCDGACPLFDKPTADRKGEP